MTKRTGALGRLCPLEGTEDGRAGGQVGRRGGGWEDPRPQSFSVIRGRLRQELSHQGLCRRKLIVVDEVAHAGIDAFGHDATHPLEDRGTFFYAL